MDNGEWSAVDGVQTPMNVYSLEYTLEMRERDLRECEPVQMY